MSVLAVFFISVFLDLKDELCAGRKESSEAGWLVDCVHFPPWLYEDRVSELLKVFVWFQ